MLESMNATFLRKCALIISLITGLVLGLSFSVRANEGAPEPEKTAPGPTVVEVPVLLMPIATSSGRMHYYAYLLIQLEIPSPNDRWSVEDKIPYIQDAFVRELHARPNVQNDDPMLIDVPGIKARLAARIHDIFGDDRVGEIIFKELALPRGAQSSE